MTNRDRHRSNEESQSTRLSKNNKRKSVIVVNSNELSSVNNVLVNYETAVMVISTFGGAVLRLEGYVPLDEVRRWLQVFVVNFFERVEVVFDSQLLFCEILIDDEAHTRLKLVVRLRSCTFTGVIHSTRVALLLRDPVFIQLAAGLFLKVFCV